MLFGHKFLTIIQHRAYFFKRTTPCILKFKKKKKMIHRMNMMNYVSVSYYCVCLNNIIELK